MTQLAILTGGAVSADLGSSLPAQAVSTAGKRGGILNFGVSLEPPRLDPQTHAYVGVIDLLTSVVYDRLVDYTADTTGVTPNLADRWTVSPDGLTYTFVLHPGVLWHNGDPLTADDVVFSFERLLDPKTAAPYGPVFGAGIKVAAVDPHTVRFTLASPNAAFMSLVALPAASILNKKFVTGGNDPATTMMGTGPFKYVDRQRGVQLRVVRNEHYRIAGRPYLDGITFRFLPDDTARVTGLRTKTVDMIDFTPQARMAAIQATAGLHLYTDKKVSIVMFAMRQDPPLDNVKVRQALSCAIDRRLVRNAGLYGRGTVVTGGPLWEGNWAYSPDVKQVYSYDPERAKEILKGAGYGHGLQGAISITAATDPLHRNPMEAAQASLKAIGIDADLKLFDGITTKQKQITGDFQVLGEVLIETYADPDFLWSYYHSKSLWGRILKQNDPQLDMWLDQARALTDRAQRKALYTKVQQRVMETVPMILLVRREWGDSGWDYVQNYVRFPGLAWQGEEAADWWLKK